jgi:hypothetical protein
MRWKPLTDRELPAILGWPLVALTSPVWGALVLIIYLEDQKRKALGPSAEWKPWFAWHPVHVWDEGAVWLEWVERRRHWNMTEYRTPPKVAQS